MGKYLDLVKEIELEEGADLQVVGPSIETTILSGIRSEPFSSIGATTLTTETTEAPLPAAVELVCYCCRRQRFWRSIYDVVICATCHPPADPSLVTKWITSDGMADA